MAQRVSHQLHIRYVYAGTSYSRGHAFTRNLRLRATLPN